jgi:RNA polymerase sigma-B factor
VARPKLQGETVGSGRRTQAHHGSSVSRRQKAACTPSALLFRRLHRGGDRVARETLVRRFLPLAHRVARRYVRSSEPQEDLVQVACVALVGAIDRFDPDRGTSFHAFAVPTISGELKRYFRDTAWAVHVPRGAQERALATERAVETLTNKLGHPPTVPQIASHLSLSDEDVLDGLYAGRSYNALSLDTPVGVAEDERDLTVTGTLGADDERYELIEADATLATTGDCLSDLERRILRLRFVEELTQADIGARVGVSQMQVSRLLSGAIAKLRERAGVADPV